MAYFTQDFLDFFTELKENNDREWFKANKKPYEKNVKEPFKAFIEDLIKRMNELDPEVQLEAKNAIFRIHRDTRFSKDKTPYKTQVSAVVSRGGRKDMRTPGIYIELSDDKVRQYSGVYMPAKEDLIAIREAIAERGPELRKYLNDKKFKDVFGELRGDKNKVLPKEFKEAAAQEPLIYHKQFYFFNDRPGTDALKDNLVDSVMENYLVGKPVTDFLKEAMGIE